MSRLQNALSGSKTDSSTVNLTPTYNYKGRDISQASKKKKRKLTIIASVVLALLGILYIPAFLHSFSKPKEEWSGYSVTLDTTALKNYTDYFSSTPNVDYDGDGIDNSKEKLESCNPWDIDSDKDHASDYYELYVSRTSPYIYNSDIAINEQQILDSNNNKSVSTPYNMGNVILWADDYNSKVFGSCVETVYGYRFSNFTGYAQFPNAEDKYVYSVNDGVHTLLEYQSDEDAWRIENIERVEIYDEPLEPVIEYGIFGKKMYSEANFLTKFLEKVMPSYGILSASKKTIVDVEPDVEKDIIADISVPTYNKEDFSRFANNNILLSDLQFVRVQLLDNKCVAVSLFNNVNGEYIGIIYGYTHNGDLLIADPETKSHIGTITIYECGTKLLTNEGNFEYYTYYNWEGMGFSSDYYDHISFFAVSD